MAENDPQTINNIDQNELQEEYLKSLTQLEEGQLVEGRVIEVSNELVFIDVGYKSEGKIPVTEFDELPQINDKVTVLLVKKEGNEGQIIVSKQKADEQLFLKALKESFQEKTAVEGTFSKVVNGGFEVDFGHGVRGFAPISQTDVVRIENSEDYLGIKSKFILDRLYSNNKLKIIASRRQWLEREIERKKKEFFTNTQLGDEVEGTVKSFTSFGAFIDLDGFDGLLHINDMSWGHVTRPKDYMRKGEKIKLKVIHLDEKEQRINLSLKHFTQNPWETFQEHYQTGDIIKGKVTKLTDFGAFVELEEGIEGLAHISELSWVKRVNHPREILQVGDEVDVKILGVDLDHRKISLGIKQVHENPWDKIEEKYPPGLRLKGPIKKVTNAGAFIELEEGIDGFLHLDDISWTGKTRSITNQFKVDNEMEVVVIESDSRERRIRLGIKQLTENPWDLLAETYPKYSIIDGEVTNVTDFGVFVRVIDDIEGLVNKSQLTDDTETPIEKVLATYKKGDKVKACIIDVNKKKQKLSLSIKAYKSSLAREELSKYIHNEEKETKATLGDLLKEKGKEIP